MTLSWGIRFGYGYAILIKNSTACRVNIVGVMRRADGAHSENQLTNLGTGSFREYSDR